MADEAVKIPIEIDSTSMPGQLADASRVLVDKISGAAAEAASRANDSLGSIGQIASTPVEYLTNMREQLAGMMEEAEKLKDELADIEPPSIGGTFSDMLDSLHSYTESAHEAAGATEGFSAAFGDLAQEVAKIGLAYVSVEKFFELFKATFEKADKIQDVTRALEVFTGSSQRAAEAMAYFNKAQETTRDTAGKLAEMYTKILPLGIERGWGQVKLQEMIVQLDQLASKAMIAPEALISGFKRLMLNTGGTGRTNELLAVLGLSQESIAEIEKKGGDLGEELARRINEKAGTVPDSWESAIDFVKSKLLASLASGVTQTLGQGSEAMEKFKHAFMDPEFLNALKEIGKAFAFIAEVLTGMTKPIIGLTNFIAMAARDIGEVIGAGGILFGQAGARSATVQADRDQYIREMRMRTGRETLAYGPGWSPEAGGVGGKAEGIVSGGSTSINFTDDELNAIGQAGKRKADEAAKAAQAAAERILGMRDAVEDATLAFSKMFDPAPVAPWLAEIQKIQQETTGYAKQLDDLADKLDLMSKAPGIKPEERKKYQDMVQVIGDLRAGLDAATQAKIEDNVAMSNNKALLDATNAVRRAEDQFQNLSDDFFRGIEKAKIPPEAMNNFEQQFGDIAAAFKEEMDAAVRPPILQPDPETIRALIAKYRDIGAAAAAAAAQQIEKANKSFEDFASKRFEAAEQTPTAAMGGIVDFVQAAREAADEFNRRAAAGEPIQQAKLDAVWKHAADAAADQLKARIGQFGSTFADAFSGALEGGAKGFADAAAAGFTQSVHKGLAGIGQTLASFVASALPGGQVDVEALKASGYSKEEIAGFVAKSDQQKATIAAAMTTTIQAVGQVVQIMQQAKQGQAPSVIGTAVSFAIAGATFGYIGAIVGAVVGAVIGIIGQAKAKASSAYALYGIEGGTPYVKAMPGFEKQFANVPQQQINEMLNQMQTTLENSQNEYIKLLGRFPKAIEDFVNVTAANFAPTMDTWKKSFMSFMDFIKTGAFGFLYNPSGKGGGILGGGTSTRVVDQGGADLRNPNVDWKIAFQNFQSDFQNWVNHTLPQEIAAGFEKPLAAGFASLGLSVERFAAIWERLVSLDPKDAVKSMNDLFDALTDFKTVINDLDPKQFGITVGLFTKAREDMSRSFADALAQADVQLVQMGETLNAEIPGPEQIADAKAWGDALMQREQSVKQFFQQVAQAIDNFIAGIQSKIRDLTLAGMKTPEGQPDVQAQVAYLKKYADSLWQQIQKATTVEQTTQLGNELSSVISQIQQLGGSVSPEAAEAYRKWAIEQLGRAQDLVVDHLNKLAQDVEKQNEAFLDAIKDFIAAFEGATDALNNFRPPGEPPPAPEPPPPPPPNHNHRPPGEEGDGDGRPGHNYGAGSEVVYTPPAQPVGYGTPPEGNGTPPEGYYNPRVYTEQVEPPPEQLYQPPPPVDRAAEAMGAEVLAVLKDMDQLMPAPEVFVAMHNDLGKMVEQQGQIIALLAQGVPVDVAGAVDVNMQIEDQTATVVVPVSDRSYNARQATARGRRA